MTFIIFVQIKAYALVANSKSCWDWNIVSAFETALLVSVMRMKHNQGLACPSALWHVHIVWKLHFRSNDFHLIFNSGNRQPLYYQLL